MKSHRLQLVLSKQTWFLLSAGSLFLIFGHADGQQTPAPADPNPYLMGSEGYDKGPRGLTSYQPDAIARPFAERMAEDVAAKPGIEREHQALLDERYDLGDHPAQGVTMEHGKPLQEGVRVKLPAGHDLGTARGNDPGRDPRAGAVAERLPTLAASHPCNRRLRDSTERDRPDQEPGWARPDPLRYRFRSARTLPRSLSTGDVSRFSVPTLATCRRAS